MTGEELFNQVLTERYVGKRIAGPSYSPEPFTVTRVAYDEDYDYVGIWFWGDVVDARGVPVGRNVSMSYGQLPEVLP